MFLVVAINLSACKVRCIIGGVDYSAQVVGELTLAYDLFQGGQKAGGVIPLNGQIQLGCVLDGKNLPIDRAQFPPGKAISLSVEWAGTYYPLPRVYSKLANYSKETLQTTIAIGCIFSLNSEIPQDVDSRAADIRIGGNRSGAKVLGNLLRELGLTDDEINFEPDSQLRFRYPRNFGSSYIQAIDDIANSESAVVFATPTGVTIREAWTVADPEIAPVPLGVLGTFRHGKPESFADQIALDREMSEFSQVALPGQIGSKYTVSANYYLIHETPDEVVNRSADGRQKTIVYRDFSGATVRTVETIREDGADIYAGIANQPTGEVEAENNEVFQYFDAGEPGRLLRERERKQVRVAKQAKSLQGWYSQNGDTDQTNDDGEVTANPYPGQLWSSYPIAEQIDTTWAYDPSRTTIPTSRTVEREASLLEIISGLTNGIPWDLIIEAFPNLSDLQFASKETIQWDEEAPGQWSITQTAETVKALDDTGERSAMIGGLQRAADEGDSNLARFWILKALRKVTRPTLKTPASPDNSPPAFTPKPRRWVGVGANIKTSIEFPAALGDLPINKSFSLPYVSDLLAASEGGDLSKQNAQTILTQAGRLERMGAQSWEIESPPYPELLENFGPYSAIDVFNECEARTYRVITAGMALSLTEQQASISMISPTLAEVVGSEFISPFSESTDAD